MGIEQLIPKDTETEGYWALQVLWKVGGNYDPTEKAIIDEAIEYSLTLPMPPVLGDTLTAVVDKDKEGIVTIAIGKEVKDTEHYEAHCLTYPGDIFDKETRPIIGVQICHILMMKPNNPLQLHWRFLPGAERPTISIEGVEKIEKVSKYIAYTKEMGVLFERIGDLFKSGRGRPEDIAESKRIVAMAKKIKERHPKFPVWRIASEIGISESNLYYHQSKVDQEHSKKHS